MNLRKNKHYTGFYLDLNNNSYIAQKSSHKKTIHRKNLISTACKEEMNKINYLILKNLYSSKRKSPLITCKLEISNKLSKFLMENYQINNKFKDGSKRIVDFNFKIERFFNETDYCTIYQNHTIGSSFKLRLAKPRKLNYYSDHKLDSETIYYKTILHIRFTVDDKKRKT